MPRTSTHVCAPTSWQRAVAAALLAQDAEAERAARDRVHTAKAALGERGTPWWDQEETERRARSSEGPAALDEGTDGG
ncbi:hypothetical protein NC315_39065 [Streptomyces sp. G2]|uniref:hypothetical protein n=1 Tax=Streptomyces TaxID=1883 RepID=UPI00202E2211|nr:hypothetical protein [Streptomyces sp. G2]MCM1951307.1 hypothetical protein [Streptomyces sp. G2]